MAAQLHFLSQSRLIDSNGIADGASIYFYQTGTLTPAAVYTTSALSVHHSHPIVVNAGAAVPAIYLDSAVTYRRRIVYTDGTVDDTDPYILPSASGIGTTGGDTIQAALDVRTPSVSTIAALKAVAAPVSGATASVLGFGASGDGGGGLFRWDGAATDDPIDGLVVQPTAGGDGRWFRLHEGVISYRMCGARIDGVTFDDAALNAMSDYLNAYDDCRQLLFDGGGGQSRILEEDGLQKVTPFRLSGFDGVVSVFAGIEFLIDVEQATTLANCNVLEFIDCKHVTFVGTLIFRAANGFTADDLINIGSIAGMGTVGVGFSGDCSYSTIDIDARGILMPANFVRTPSLTIHPRLAARIGAAGSGYSVGNVLTLANLGSPTGIAANATTAATFTVSAIDGSGGVTAVTTTTRGLWPYSVLVNVGLKAADTGFPVTGGGGGGATLLPYVSDYGAEHGEELMRFCRVRLKARFCYYGLHLNYNLAESEVWVDVDYIYRGCVSYGGNGPNVVWMRDRNHRGDSCAGGSVHGLGTKLILHYCQLPTRTEDDSTPETTLNTNASSIRMSYDHGIPGEVELDVTFDVDVPSTANYFGTLFEIDKSALDGNETKARGHIGRFSVGGTILGKGRVDSGLGTDGLIGTNVNIVTSGGTWEGDTFHWHFRDGFRHEGLGNIIINAKSLGSLVIGRISSDGAITTDSTATAGATALAMAPTGTIAVNPRASFRNRFNAAAYFPLIGDILIAADFTITAGLSGHHFHLGTGTAATIRTLTLPPAVRGLEFTFTNGTSAAGGEFHITPSGTQTISDGGSVGGGGKKWRLTGLGAHVHLKCFTGGTWHIINSHGTQSIEP